MKIKVLVDNTAANGFPCEWGLAMALELDSGATWLLDAGQSDLFMKTARAMDVDIMGAAGMILSHGHWDHTGGLDQLLDAGFTAPIFGHEDIVLTRYSLKGESREIGLPGRIPEFVRVHGKTRLAKDLWMLADIPRLEGNHQAVDGFYLDREGKQPDPVRDDSCLVAETRKGPVLILGCCHSGLANTLDAVASRLGVHTPYAVIGGTHLYNASDAAREQAARALESARVQQVVAGHCTGEDGLKWLQSRLAIPVTGMGSGTVVEF